ncbi:MAG: YncE family protein [Candidimonas sp.]
MTDRIACSCPETTDLRKMSTRPIVFTTRIAASLAIVALAACAGVDSPRATGSANQTSISNVSQDKNVGRAAVAPGLFELAHMDHRLYVTSAGDDRRNGKPGHILVIDPGSLTILQSVESAEKPFALAVNRKTRTLYVGHSMDRRVSVYDMRDMARTAVIQLDGIDKRSGKPYRSRQLLVDETTNTVYVSSPSDDGPVWVIDGATSTLRGTIEAMGGPGLALDPVQGRLYTSGRGFWRLADTKTGKMIARHPVQDKPERFLVNVDIDPKTSRLFASDSKHGELLVLEPASGKATNVVATGAGAMGVKINAPHEEVYVSNRQAGTVTVIDTNTLAVKRSIEIKPFPNSFAIDETTGEVYVSVKQSRDPKSAGYRNDKKESIARFNAKMP